MKLPFLCMECFANDENPSRVTNMDVNDEGAYQLTCDKGHKTVTVSQAPKFCILAEMGLLALSRNHYREAVLNFSSSAERFLEYYIRIISLSRKLGFNCIDSAWKNLSKQSERQLGAFLWLYVMENGAPCEYFSNSVIELRNSITHKGYIPKKDETENYCKKVLDFIVPKYRELQEKQSKAISTFLSNRKSELNKNYSPQRDTAVIGFNTIIDHLVSESYDFDSYAKFLGKISFH